ncbi:MAG: hypothetical protein IJI36_10030 [Kiritimatiellae bacterium]|nr:hypothetical protein [Kiritimatiellia bacterium]
MKRFLPLARSLFAVAFLVLLAPAASSLLRRGAWSGANNLAERFPARHFLVELNGGVHRVAGRRLCNAVYRSPEGMLLSELRVAEDVSRPVESVAAFAAWLEERRVPYVYVQTPAKVDMADKMLPSCFESSGNRQVDVMLAALAERNVRTVDLRAEFTATPEDVGRYFYRTDHHWNNDAAFKAFGALVPAIAHACDMDPSPAEPLASPMAWHREVWPQCFMGSKARRTGRWFGGLDDLVVYTPKFPTEMSIEIPSKRISLSGDFRQTVMWHSGKARRGAAGFRRDAYSLLYVGGGDIWRGPAREPARPPESAPHDRGGQLRASAGGAARHRRERPSCGGSAKAGTGRDGGGIRGIVQAGACAPGEQSIGAGRTEDTPFNSFQVWRIEVINALYVDRISFPVPAACAGGILLAAVPLEH